MKTADHALQPECMPTVFTLRLHGQVYRCAVSDEALYLLSQKMDPGLDRIDAYLLLKRRVACAAQACLDDGAAGLPALMEARHVIAHA
ncbi:hypothetical protein [Noviherbaspirillum suwonense]|jgi:hypothetical protein|uniref:DUF1488 domain-containing protein n=1 Tax=Noviherbaspirillum suwonense TaxID=1224511 RepID=A0ABY1PUP3_9BURK|nr:hypothetical protein [Noviherbaspirillum suwonense]SMP49105.1 hypothetical protein SAMN06295970_102203 [Noviherbaspirillum suwonense]